MRLSVYTPENSQQLLIDLKKLYQNYLSEDQLTDTALQSWIESEQSEVFITLFNARHLGAVQVVIEENEAVLSRLCVRDITRRRGVAKNLLKEVEGQLSERRVTLSKMFIDDISEQEKAGLSLFMGACGYQLIEGVFTKELLESN
ncbi:MAG: aspartate 1-decarboxylase autocleavage activator PanM [Psychromonas sp.]